MTGDERSAPDEKLLSLFRRSWISLTRKRSVRSLFWLGLALVFGSNLLELDRRVKFRGHYKLHTEMGLLEFEDGLHFFKTITRNGLHFDIITEFAPDLNNWKRHLVVHPVGSSSVLYKWKSGAQSSHFVESDLLSDDYVLIEENGVKGACCSLIHMFRAKPEFEVLERRWALYSQAVGKDRLEFRSPDRVKRASRYTSHEFDLRTATWVTEPPPLLSSESNVSFKPGVAPDAGEETKSDPPEITSKTSNGYRFDIIVEKPKEFSTATDTHLTVTLPGESQPYYDMQLATNHSTFVEDVLLSDDFVVVREWSGGASCCLFIHIFSTKPYFRYLHRNNNDFFDKTKLVVGEDKLELHEWYGAEWKGGVHAGLEYQPRVFDLRKGHWVDELLDEKDTSDSLDEVARTVPLVRKQFAGNPSFPCEDAMTKSEWQICSSKELGELDTKMADIYFWAQGTVDYATGYKELWRQRNWLHYRDARCVYKRDERLGDRFSMEDCLRSVYQERVAELDAKYSSFLNGVSPTWNDDSKGDPECGRSCRSPGEVAEQMFWRVLVGKNKGSETKESSQEY